MIVDMFGTDEREQGPSWARPNWPVAELDEVNAGLDPTLMSIEPVAKKAAAVATAAGKGDVDVRQAADDSIRAMMLIRTYRVRGHLAANLDPLGLSKRDLPADLTPEFHGFSGDALDRQVYLGGALGFEFATVRQIVEVLRRNYCGNVGLEYMHINDLEERRFLQERMEGKDAEIHFTPEGKKAILSKVIQGEQWEKFLARKYVGTKRFGLDGGESMVPALEAVIKYGGQYGLREMVLGMAHRGRLNVLANVMGKPYRAIFNEFAGGATNPEDVGGSGDVKYHLGTSSDREFDGIEVHMSLVPNPSHLEAVDPVVLGKARGVQMQRGDLDGSQVIPVLLHGDAAFAGQGIVASPRLRDRRHDPFRHQQSGRLHDQPAVRAVFALSVGYRQERPGADPARQRRRSGGGDLRLQARHRISPGVQARHRHRHVVLSPLRP
jgi:2-oxoglutarate dehydrogenase E1 component